MSVFTVPIPTRAEIIDIVKNGSAAVVWITRKGAIISFPGLRNLRLVVGVDQSFFEDPDFRQADAPMVYIEGVSGIAATDPFWDGSEVFICKDPQCNCFGLSKNIDDVVHDNNWRRAKEKSVRCPKNSNIRNRKRRKRDK